MWQIAYHHLTHVAHFPIDSSFIVISRTIYYKLNITVEHRKDLDTGVTGTYTGDVHFLATILQREQLTHNNRLCRPLDTKYSTVPHLIHNNAFFKCIVHFIFLFKLLSVIKISRVKLE